VDWDLLGHSWAVENLANEIASGTVRHAYLFCGQEGLGRRTLALRLAQALNCPTPPAPGDACRNCRTCSQIERMSFSDLSIIQAEEVGGVLKVDQVRELLHSLALMPYEAKVRVAVLLRFEEAHPSAMNALLKSLEEPPAQVVIVITADSAESLLPTIASRCEILRLRPMPIIDLSQGLQSRKGLPAQTADLYAHLSGGRPGVALRMADNPELVESRKMWIEYHKHSLVASRRERFLLVEELLKDREFYREGLRIWLSLWRDVMLVSFKTNVSIVNLDLEEEISHLAEQFGQEGSIQKITILEKTVNLLDRNINPRLALEVLMLDLPTIAD
jgi:DNA polymerase III subunit delta'